MTKFNMLFLVHNVAWTGGGTFYRALHLGRHLVQRRHAVTLLATSPGNRLRFSSSVVDGVTVVESPDLFIGRFRSGWDIWNAAMRMFWLVSRRFELVHAFESRPVVIFPALLAQRMGATLIMDWCDWFGRGGAIEERASWVLRHLFGPIETLFEERFRPQADGITVINPQLQERALKLGIPQDRILMFPNGSDINMIQTLDKTWAREQLGFPQDKFIIGYLGQAFPQDAMLLASSFDLLNENSEHNLLMLIGNHRTDISSFTNSKDDVIETGFLSSKQLSLYLGACDLFWLPLRDTLANRGRWPSKINDYLAAGRPIVATSVGSLVPLFNEHEIGLLAAPIPQDIVQKTLTLRNNAELRERCGRVAREVAETEYAWSKLAELVDQFYARAAASSPIG